MRPNKILALLIFLLWTLTAGAVSKVGGGILSNDMAGFMASIPPSYDQFSISKDQDVRLDARPVFREARFVFAHLLENEQPGWIGRTDRQEFADHFQQNGWQRIPHAEVCVEQWEKNNGSATTRILSWGDGRGAIFVSPARFAADVSYLGDSLKLMTGVCSWK